MALGDKVQIVLEIEADLLEMSSPQQPRHSGKSKEVSSTASAFADFANRRDRRACHEPGHDALDARR
jgi:hypothetical protein